MAPAAGVSLRVVQYHFDSKHRLLVCALRLLHEDNDRSARSRIPAGLTDPRAPLRAVLDEFLPLDGQRDTALRVFAAPCARSPTAPGPGMDVAHDRCTPDDVRGALEYHVARVFRQTGGSDSAINSGVV